MQSKYLHDEKLCYLSFHQMVWTWRGGHFARFAMKHQVLVTRRYIVQSHPDLTFEESRPENIYMPVFSHNHSTTYWQQDLAGNWP